MGSGKRISDGALLGLARADIDDLRTENAELRRKLEAMTAARDGWQDAFANCVGVDPGPHIMGCPRGNDCNCPAALNLEAEKV